MEEHGPDVVAVPGAGTSGPPDKSYYYQLSKCVNCSKSIHKLERSVPPATPASIENNNTEINENDHGHGPETTDYGNSATFTDLTRNIKRHMQSMTTEPFLISALHYTACVEAMRYIYQLTQDDVDHLLQLNSTNEVTLCRACGDLIKNSYNGMRALEKLRDKEANLEVRLSQKNTRYHVIQPGDTAVPVSLPAPTGDEPLEVVWHVVHENAAPPERQDQETMTESIEPEPELPTPRVDLDPAVPETQLLLPDRVDQETMTDAPEYVMEVVVAEDEPLQNSVAGTIQYMDQETVTEPLSHLSFPPSRTQSQTRVRRYSTEDSRILTATTQFSGSHPMPLRVDKATLTEPIATATTEHICWSCGEPSLQTTTAPFADDKATMTETRVLTPVEDKETITQIQNEDKATMAVNVGQSRTDQTTMTTREAIDIGIDTSDSPWNKTPESKHARVTKATLMKLSNNGLKASVSTAEESRIKIVSVCTLTDKKEKESKKKTTRSNSEPLGKRIKLEPPEDIVDEVDDPVAVADPLPSSSSSYSKAVVGPSCASTDVGKEITSPVQKLLQMLIKGMSNEMRIISGQVFSLQQLISINRGPMDYTKTSSILHSMSVAARNIYASLDEGIITIKVYESSSKRKLQNGKPNAVPVTAPQQNKATQPMAVDVLAAYFKLLIRIEKVLDTRSNCRFWITLAVYKHRIMRVMKHFLEAAYASGGNGGGMGSAFTTEAYFMNICYCLSKAISAEEASDVDVPSFGAAVWAQIQGWSHPIDENAATLDHRTLGVNGFNQQIFKIFAAIERTN